VYVNLDTCLKLSGFVKAFTDQPEHITSGLSPLKNIMKELQLRTVHIYPRYYSPVRVLRLYSHIYLDFMKKSRHLLNDVEQMSSSCHRI
jgi:hypothetical protein